MASEGGVADVGVTPPALDAFQTAEDRSHQHTMQQRFDTRMPEQVASTQAFNPTGV